MKKHNPTSPIILGAIYIVLSELMFSSMGATVKALSQHISTEMIVFMRNLLGVLILSPWLFSHRSHTLKTSIFHLHLFRAMAGLGAMYCFFYVLGHMPLAEGMVLKMTAPIFIPLVAALWLGERAPWLAIAAIPLGMVGVVLIVHPEGAMRLTALVGLLGGVLAAIAKVAVRRLSHSEPTTRIVFYFALLGMLVSVMPLFWAWKIPSVDSWLLILGLGLFGTIGQIFLTRGYTLAPSARISPFTWFSVVFGALFGYLFWGETLSWMFVIGAGLIACSGLMAVYGSRVKSI